MGTIFWPASMTSLQWALFFLIYVPLVAVVFGVLHWLRSVL